MENIPIGRLSVWGEFREMYRGLLGDGFAVGRAMVEWGGSVRHLKRGFRDPLLMDAFLERAIGYRQRVQVEDMPRNKVELEKHFGRVSKVFYEEHEWTLHSSCVGIDETPGERKFSLSRQVGLPESEDAIRRAAARGYRQATHHELYAFMKANPRLNHPEIVALGSSTTRHAARYVAVAGTPLFSSRRQLELRPFYQRHNNTMLLLVQVHAAVP